MARDPRTRTRAESLVIVPNSSHGDADGDTVLAVYPIDSDDINGSPTAVFSVTENGVMTQAGTTFTGTITLSNGETIDNATNGTVQVTSAVLKHAVDSLAYWTATQADGGAVTFDSVSDGTAGFTFSDAVSVTRDDTTDGIVDALTLTHSSSDNAATAGDGAGISFKLENATGTSTVEEWASIDAVSTTITNGSEDGDMAFNLMLGGTVSPAMLLDASDQSLTLGTNATDADGIYRLRVYPVTTAKGSLVLSATANTGDSVTTITNAAQGGAYTYTIPNAGSGFFAVSTAALTLGEVDVLDGVTAGTVTASKAVVLDASSQVNDWNVTADDTTDGIVNVLTLTHSSSDDNATAGDGAGISFQLENATGTSTVEEWASIDAVSTTITDGSEDGDIAFSQMLAGTVTQSLLLDASDQSLTIGRNSTDANGLNQLRVFPLTASKGSVLLSATANTGDSVTTITNAAQGGAYTYTIPDAGASANFVMSQGAQTVAGAKTFSSALITGAGNGAASGTGVVATEYGDGVLHKTTLALTNTPVVLADNAGVVAYGGLKIYDMPEGAIMFVGAVSDLDLTLSAAGVNADWDGDVGLGTVTATNDGTLAGTEQNIIPTTATPQAAASATTANALSTATENAVQNGTSTAIDVYLNLLVDDADHDVTSTPTNIICNGTVTLTWINLGDF